MDHPRSDSDPIKPEIPTVSDHLLSGLSSRNHVMTLIQIILGIVIGGVIVASIIAWIAIIIWIIKEIIR